MGPFKPASIPVYARGPAPIVVEPIQPATRKRTFIVELGETTVKVNGETVVAPQSGTRHDVFRILWRQYIEDLKKGSPASEFKALKVKEVADQLGEMQEKQIYDDATVRRTINRLQEDIETAVKKKLGDPIGREDIVQTCRWTGSNDKDYGYRLNPYTVVARPAQES